MLTVAVPSWSTPPAYLRQAVESVLAQDVPLTLVLVNDASPTWDPLADITDERLVRFTLTENRGWPYCEALVLAACTTEFFTAHDADDWSEPGRYATLLDAIEGHAAAVSPTIYHWPDRGPVPDPVKPQSPGHGTLGTIARHPAHLYRAEALRGIGIPADLRGSVDTAMVSLFWHRHQVAVVEQALYNVRKWDGSLTAHPDTRGGTPWRKAQRAERRRRFEAALTGGRLAGPGPEQRHVDALRERL